MSEAGPARGPLSFRSPEVRRLRNLVRERRSRSQEGSFVVEGALLVAEALSAGAHVQVVHLDEKEARAEHRDLAARCERRGARVTETSHGVLARACDAVTPQPIAAIVSALDVPLVSLRSAPPPVVVVCAGLQDPGNAGAVLRVAGASGAGAVVFSAGSVDVYNPKAVRASAGALFRVPVVAGEGLEEVLDELGRWGLRRTGAVTRGGRHYAEEDLATPTALVIGNEGAGLPAGTMERLESRVTIPMAGGVQSLNVATAAAVLCFEAARQRRARP